MSRNLGSGGIFSILLGAIDGKLSIYQHCSVKKIEEHITLKNKCYIIAGPNGAGKTTFANEFLPIEAECLNFINADLIAQGLSPFQPNKMAIKAGRLMIQNINGCVKKSESFAFETTLSGKGYINWLIHGLCLTLLETSRLSLMNRSNKNEKTQ